MTMLLDELECELLRTLVVDPLITMVVVPADCELDVGLTAVLVLCDVERELDAVELEVGLTLLTLELLDRALDELV